MIYYIIRFFLCGLALWPAGLVAQSHNYWSRSFNEESSLLSGAVVGGGSGPSAIYYNPANISEVKASKFSVNASLFSFDFINVKNALGDGINLTSSKANIEPRFVSYMIKGKKHPDWSLEIAFLNNENTKTELMQSIDMETDILSKSPGQERYFAFYKYYNQFRDDWIGFGGSKKIGARLYFGMGFFIIIKSLNYSRSLDIEAYSVEDMDGPLIADYNIALYQSYQYLKFNDYRLNGKAGITYKGDSFSIGLSLTSPSIGKIYSDGKRVNRKQSQLNITDPSTGDPVPDYTIIDFKQKSDVKVSFKTPFSMAAGLTYSLTGGKRTIYFTAEYFSGLESYKMVTAEESENIAIGSGFTDLVYTDWLTFVSGARPVFNVAAGYSWTLKENLQLMSGFRTDFNYQKNLDYGEFPEYARVENLNLDLYYLTCGLSWNIMGQDIITGLQYTVGRHHNQRQIANLSDPVEYSPAEKLPLQGDPQNTMTPLFNSVSFYFGASFNFGADK